MLYTLLSSLTSLIILLGIHSVLSICSSRSEASETGHAVSVLLTYIPSTQTSA